MDVPAEESLFDTWEYRLPCPVRFMTNLKEEIWKDMKRDAVKLYLARKRKRIGRMGDYRQH